MLIPVERVRLLAEVEAPPMGYRTYALHPRSPRYVEHPAPAGERQLIAQPGGKLENEFLSVQIHPNGTFQLTDKVNKHTYENLHFLVDNGALGNAHIYKSPLRDAEITSLAARAVIIQEESNSLRGVYRIEMTLNIPSAATRDGKDRLRDQIELPVVTRLILHQGSRRLDIHTRLNNSARDHRLRVLFPTGIKTDFATMESAFAIEKRSLLWNNTGDNMEKHYPFQPMQNFVDVSDGKTGLAFLSRGLREYEVMDDPQRTLAITLLRTHRAYMTSTDDLTPEELEKNIRGQHCLGEMEYHYALFPHAGDWKSGKVLQEAYDHKVPMRVLQGVPKEGNLPPTQSLFTIEPQADVCLSACCQSEDGKAYILRVWNCTEEKVHATFSTALPIQSAVKVRLDETMELETLKKRGAKWLLPLRKGEIATVRLS